jgi:hypothetical protein
MPQEVTMCPECYTTIAVLLTGVISTGGATAAAVKIFRSKKTVARVLGVRTAKENAT